MCRNADFEIPFFKKQAAKHQQQLADLERRKAEAQRSAAAAAAEFLQVRQGAVWAVGCLLWKQQAAVHACGR